VAWIFLFIVVTAHMHVITYVLAFVDVAEGAEEVAAGGSRLNRAEADMVQQVQAVYPWSCLQYSCRSIAY
jgi:hypothetical protein